MPGLRLLLTEPIEIVLAETPLQERASVHTGRGVPLEENLVTAAGGVLPAPEVVLTDLVEGHGRGIGGDMTADANTGTLRAMHGNGGIPAQQTTDVPLDLGVAGVFFLVLGCNGVDVVGGGEC